MTDRPFSAIVLRSIGATRANPVAMVIDAVDAKACAVCGTVALALRVNHFYAGAPVETLREIVFCTVCLDQLTEDMRQALPELARRRRAAKDAWTPPPDEPLRGIRRPKGD